MTKINTDGCPNFTGTPHHNKHRLVPDQFKHAHLHPLWKLDAANKSDKAPRVKWGEYEGGLVDSDERYGVCLTRSRLFVLDVDVHTVDGNATLAQLARDANQPLPDTFTVRTPTGGFHYYFQLPNVDLQGNGTKKVNLWPGIDTFPKGQQVLGPGTARRMDDGSVAIYEITNDTPIAPIPDWFLDALQNRLGEIGSKSAPTPTRSAAAQNPTGSDHGSSRRGRAALDDVTSRMRERAAESFAGDRNDFLYRQAFRATRSGASLEDATGVLHKLVTAETTLAPHWDTIERGLVEGAQRADLPTDFFSPFVIAQRFADDNDDLRYVRDWKTWFQYRDPSRFATRRGVWAEASDNEALFVVTDWIKQKHDEAAEFGTEDEVNGYLRVLMSPAVATGIVRFAESLLGVEKTIFNTRKDALVASNGIVNLRTGRLHPHNAKAYSTLCTNVEYNADAQSPVWDKVRAVLMDDTHDYARMVLGIATTGFRPSANSYWVMPGKAGNGKSTLFDTVRYALDQYAIKLENGALSADKANTFGLSSIECKRFILTEEIGGRFYDAELVKDLTGGATITVAAKHKDGRNLENHGTLVMAMNYPIASPSKIDEGIRRRAKVVPFDKTVKSAADYDENNPLHLLRSQQVIDLSLSKDCLEACLAWLVSAARDWLAIENKAEAEVTLPPSVRTATTRYLVDEDPFAQIVEDQLIYQPGSYITTVDLRTMAVDELEEMGSVIKNQATIFNKFEETGFFTEHKITRKKTPPPRLTRSVYYDRDGRSHDAGATVRYYADIAFRRAGVNTADVDGGLSTVEDQQFAALARQAEADAYVDPFDDEIFSEASF